MGDRATTTDVLGLLGGRRGRFEKHTAVLSRAGTLTGKLDHLSLSKQSSGRTMEWADVGRVLLVPLRPPGTAHVRLGFYRVVEPAVNSLGLDRYLTGCVDKLILFGEWARTLRACTRMGAHIAGVHIAVAVGVGVEKRLPALHSGTHHKPYCCILGGKTHQRDRSHPS